MTQTGTVRPTRGRGGSSAFTLVELLIVMAIISLLVSLILPSLKRSRDQAGLLQCKANLRGLSRAGAIYQTLYRDWLPPGPVERAYWPGDPDRGTPNEVYDRSRMMSPLLSSREGWYGMGLLWKETCLDDGETYFCPQADRRGGVSHAQAWPRSFTPTRNPGDGTLRVLVTYVYRGGLASQVGRGDGTIRAGDHPATLGLFADDPAYGRLWHEGGYNVAFLDGHVRFRRFDAPPVARGDVRELWRAMDAWE